MFPASLPVSAAHGRRFSGTLFPCGGRVAIPFGRGLFPTTLPNAALVAQRPERLGGFGAQMAGSGDPTQSRSQE